MRWLGWLLTGAGGAFLLRLQYDADFAWRCDLVLERFWYFYWGLAAEAAIAFCTFHFAVAGVLLLAFLNRHGVVERLAQHLCGDRASHLHLPRQARRWVKRVVALLGLTASPWLLSRQDYLQWKYGLLAVVGILVPIFVAEVRLLVRRRSSRRSVPFTPLFALIAAVGVIAAEQFLQWKYGQLGVLGAAVMVLGLGTRLANPWSPPIRSSQRLAIVAAWVAGPRRPHLSAEWAAILAAADTSDTGLPPRARHRLARGFLYAAIRMRLSDMGGPLWVPVDWTLSVERRTNTVIALVVGAQAVYIVDDGGLPALVTEIWEPCGILGGSLYVLARWLRKVRGIELAAARNDTRSGE